jgi:hypothetical protein
LRPLLKLSTESIYSNSGQALEYIATRKPYTNDACELLAFIADLQQTARAALQSGVDCGADSATPQGPQLNSTPRSFLVFRTRRTRARTDAEQAHPLEGDRQGFAVERLGQADKVVASAGERLDGRAADAFKQQDGDAVFGE